MSNFLIVIKFTYCRMASRFSTHHRYLKHSFLFSLVLFCTVSFADNHEQREDRLLSAFVYKVAKFITWPENYPSSNQDHFDLCVVDNTAFSQALKFAVKSRKIANLKIDVRNVIDELDLSHCHLLYFKSSEPEIITRFLLKTNGQPILTVASTPNFIKQGGMIAFERTDNKINLSIDNDQAKKEGLVISAHLLRLNRLKK